jgi:hypothetical protein
VTSHPRYAYSVGTTYLLLDGEQEESPDGTSDLQGRQSSESKW